jgi:regulator of nucleoside diphosphate kinase
MNISIIAFILFLAFAAALLVLFVAGLLVRSDVHRAARRRAGVVYPRSRTLEDLRPVQDLVVDFFGEARPSRQLLDFLGEYDETTSLAELRANLPFGPEKLWTAVVILSAARLIRFGRNGLTLTDAGRAVRARLDEVPVAATTEDVGARGTAEAVDGIAAAAASPELDTRGSSHLQLVRDALRLSESVVVPRRIRATSRMKIGQLRKATAEPSNSSDNGSIPTAANAARRVSITAADHQELSAAIAAARKLAVRAGEMRPLQDKLAHATITRPGELPHDLITMNTRAEVVDLETNEHVELLLVYPAEANVAEGRVSVFHPLGAAMLGHRVGDEFEWPVPYGVRRFKVATVQFQPEAALALAA